MPPSFPLCLWQIDPVVAKLVRALGEAASALGSFFGRRSGSIMFNDALTKLRLSVYASAPLLGISLRQAQRYSAGEQEVSRPVANQLTLLVNMVTRWKAERKKNREMIEFFEDKNARPRIHADGRDITDSWVMTLRDRDAEWEKLLRAPGDGIPSQID